MKLYKKATLLASMLALFLFVSCNSEDEPIQDSEFTIEITNFEASYDKVQIDWSFEKGDDVHIQKIYVIRTTTDQNGFVDTKIIATLPATQFSYIDTDIPYFAEISYKVTPLYVVTDAFIESEFYDYISLDSEIKTYDRNIVFFNEVPFQVKKDPLDDHIFHLIDRLDIAALKKYDFNDNTVIKNADLSENYTHNVVFKVIDNLIYIGDDTGKFRLINKSTYEIEKEFMVAIDGKLKSFAVDGDRIYYHDNDVLKLYNLSTEVSLNLNLAYLPSKFMETITGNQILFESTKVAEISSTNCPDNTNCNPNILYSYDAVAGEELHHDPYIFSFNKDKTKFITSYFGDVVNLSNLTKEASLKEITGENYFQAVFDNEGKIYATVQGKKMIHVFNADYELIDTIETKLYPLFPLLTSEGLKVIGSYTSVQYSGYLYGLEFNFNDSNGKCAIEVF
ncbi:hypothetical protein SAMN05216503_1537 [Polaribacter sp. KT25b]|uniref:hypothetical protein n=1 Tax=Polaribacter sp. KT25b TaxID=1855336 RepID=UPI00087C165A|nr:hypothetical protein [Polaribacter sp. KT25b]SDR96554.1 hypothetical protein SAMN05216503_1537 [Polaribacter sp. KT25b]